MKKRIKIDSSLLSFVIILTGFLYLFPGLYGSNRFFDNVLDFIGMMGVLKGVVLRMAARGHKKANSRKGQALVTEGLYSLTRNPMYLGSFLIGAGFVFIVWPWWTLPLFAGLFYMRFNKQMVKEEAVLSEQFGKVYQDYCRKSPRIFPSISTMIKFKVSTIINMKELFSTKEKRGLIGWPLLAVVLETFQEMFLFKSTDIFQTCILFISSMAVFALMFAVAYYKR
ncbi:hypothetical protein MNBD_UNCLBAC01-720 [hydrothermal vent metagenome]|uniref:Steroid 5-alpha reductase C-terminal domain-containing protein n=1 Tax=hydrothermal vent metagenome TaxID=652676 RepID=A0A3B1DPH1_9ZZZZ